MVNLPTGITNADQGSDLNLISHALIDVMGYTLVSLKSKGFLGLAINTADGNFSRLDSYVVFDMEVMGIRRTVHAFCRPRPPKRDDNDLHLLLGLPWLYDVDA